MDVAAVEDLFPSDGQLGDGEGRSCIADGQTGDDELDKAPLMDACAPALEKFVSDNGLEDMYAAIQALA